MTWMLTRTGNDIDLRHMPQDDIRLVDIAYSLAHTNRFNGHTERPYSVAEHSLLVCQVLGDEFAITEPIHLLAGLMHDAHEAYTGDLSAPMKQIIGAAWANEEIRIQNSVLTKFGLRAAFNAHRHSIHRADMIALATERRDLMPPIGPDWPCLANAHPLPHVHLLHDRVGMEANDWKQAFLDKFEELSHAIELRREAWLMGDQEAGLLEAAQQ